MSLPYPTYVRTPGACSTCNVMGHTKRTCRIALLRRVREPTGTAPTQEEEEAVKVELRSEFERSSQGIRWRERVLHRTAAMDEYRMQERRRAAENLARRLTERAALERPQAAGGSRPQAAGGSRPAPRPSVDLDNAFVQLQSWVRRAEREARTRIREARAPKSLSLKMIDDFKDYAVEEECAICYDAVPTVGLPCKHTFCATCTKRSAKTRNTCPMCRDEFSEVFICRDISPEEFNKVSTTILL